MSQYTFDELRLHRINVSAFEDNAASIRFLERCGCKREGLQREAVFKKGRYKKLVTLAILKEDYNRMIAEKYWK